MLSSYTTRSKRRRQDLNLRRSLNRSPLAEECFQPLSHFSSVGRAGIEPATNKGRFYRALPAPIGEPTQRITVPTGLEPAIPRLKAWWLNHLPTAPYLTNSAKFKSPTGAVGCITPGNCEIHPLWMSEQFPRIVQNCTDLRGILFMVVDPPNCLGTDNPK